MTNPIPPGWGEDPLSNYLNVTRDNQLAAFVHHRNQYLALREVADIFQVLNENLNETTNWFGSIFSRRAQSAFFASVGLSLGGQVAELYASLRLCLEQSLYALHLTGDPERVRVFLNRHESKAARNAVKKEFSHSAVTRTLISKDEPLAKRVSELYERAIDFGAHPNEKSVSATTAIDNDGPRRRITVSYVMSGDSPAYQVGVLTTLQVGVAALGILAMVFPERFALLGLEERLSAVKKRSVKWDA
jgi:hypothetical protein